MQDPINGSAHEPFSADREADTVYRVPWVSRLDERRPRSPTRDYGDSIPSAGVSVGLGGRVNPDPAPVRVGGKLLRNKADVERAYHTLSIRELGGDLRTGASLGPSRRSRHPPKYAVESDSGLRPTWPSQRRHRESS